ncbi:MAG: hypothetical protein WBF87_15760 [Mesorhizobium sp.]
MSFTAGRFNLAQAYFSYASALSSLGVIDMKSEMPLRKISTPLAIEASELLLLQADLGECIEGFKLWSVMMSGEAPEQKRAATALFRDSVIRLTSCFDNESQFNLSVDEVYGSTDGGPEYFRWMKDLRDTWIAHRNGPQRFAVYGHFINPETGDIIGEGTLLALYQPPNPDEAQMARFTQIALLHVERRLEEIIPKLRAEVEAIHPRTRLKLEVATAMPPGPGRMRVGRRKYENTIPQRKRAAEAARDSHQQSTSEPEILDK